MLEHIFTGDSEMAVRMRAVDWSTTDLGPPESWPENQRTALSICLTSRFPMQVWWGSNLTMLYNDAYIPLLGGGKHPRALGRSAREIWSEIWPQIGPMLDQVVTTGIASWSEDSQLLLDLKSPKEEVFVNFSFSPIFKMRGGEGNKVEGVFYACAEVTEKVICAGLIKARAEQLAQSENRYRSLFDSAPMALFVCDLNAVIQYFNNRAAVLWGREPVCGVDKYCGSVNLWLVDGTLLPHEESPVAEVLRTGVPAYNVEVYIERPDGSRLPVLVNFAALKDAHGNVTGSIISFVDITERKRSEEALKESERRKNEFLAMLAHELRNPLAPIRNALQILRLPGGTAQTAQLASEVLERQVGQMVRLVDDLLDVNRISRGTIALRRERIELEAAVNHAVEAVRPLCTSMDHELTVTLPSKPIFVNGDSIRLAQVVGNLLNNACKFTDKGGCIGLDVERESGHAVIRVRDSGIGIAADQLPHILDMFMQVDTSLDRSVSGLGIGLTLVKNLVRLHDGAMEVHSAGLGHGTEVTVRLPILVDAPSPRPPVPILDDPKVTTARRVLVVDDNRDSADSLAMWLQMTGNETHTAHDGVEAVEAAATFRPDLVLLDIGLPKLNGYEACRQIRQQPWAKSMTLVALTGWGQEEDRRKCTAAGFNAHMVKPVDHAVLTKLLASLPSRLPYMRQRRQ